MPRPSTEDERKNEVKPFGAIDKEVPDSETIKKAVQKYPQSSAQILEEIKDLLGLEDVSLRSLQRFLKKLVTDGSDFAED